MALIRLTLKSTDTVFLLSQYIWKLEQKIKMIVEFVEYIYTFVKFDFDSAQQKLRECEVH